MKILENDKKRIVRSKDYNTVFDKTTGYFMRWGKTKKDDPQRAHMPEIADIEISSGKCHNSCPFCYKGNSKDKDIHNMTFEEFRNIFFKIADTVLQIKYSDGQIDELPLSEIGQGYINEDIFTTYESFTGQKIRTKQQFIELYKQEYDKEVRETLKFKIYNKGLLTQIAFGITSPKDNPNFFEMMKFAREFDVIPNYTINGQDMIPDIADKTVKLCGACAISVCSDLEKSYEAVKMLSERGMKQINFHVVAMDSTFELIKRIMKDIKEETLKGLNAIVLLKYKPKGTNAGKFKPLTKEQYKEIFEYARENKIGIGFDSCSAPVYLNTIKDLEKAEQLAMYAEPCESTLFSVYINSYGECFPCSFSENECKNEENWKIGLNVLTCDNFLEIWENPRIQSFRKKLLENKRHCPMFSMEE